MGTPENNRRLYYCTENNKRSNEYNLPNSIHKLQIKPYREIKNIRSLAYECTFHFGRYKHDPNAIQPKLESHAKSPNSQFLNSDISFLLCLILLHQPWFESLFPRQSFAIACIGSTFSQRLLLGTKRSRILPLDVSLDMIPQI